MVWGPISVALSVYGLRLGSRYRRQSAKQSSEQFRYSISPDLRQLVRDEEAAEQKERFVKKWENFMLSHHTAGASEDPEGVRKQGQKVFETQTGA